MSSCSSRTAVGAGAATARPARPTTVANEKRILVWRTGSRVVNVLKIEDVDECCCDEDGLHAGRTSYLYLEECGVL